MAVTRNPGKNNDGTNAQQQQIGFGSTIPLIGATRGSEYTNNIAKIMTEVLSSCATPPKVSIFDRERLTNLEYSCLVVSALNANNEVCYHISLLEATGNNPMTAGSIVAEATRAIRETNMRANIFTPDDAINGRLHDIVVGELAAHYGPEVEFISAEGLVVHESSLDVNDLAMRVAAVAYNAVSAESKLSTGEFIDLNLGAAVKESGSSDYRLELNLFNTTANNIMGRPVRQDFKIDLVEVSRNETFEYNADSRRRLVTVGGYIDAIREDVPMPVYPGAAPTVKTELHPNIVISMIDTLSPTEGFMMLAVGAGAAMSNPELWVQSLASIDGSSHNSPGGLNLITNLEGAQGGVGEKMDLSQTAVSTEERYAILKRLYGLSPLMSCDIESYGAQSYFSSVLATAASPDNTQAKNDACLDLIDTCVRLTDGNFDPNFPASELFAVPGIIIPTGYWMDKSGERDIRDIDMAFVANHSGDVNMINQWCMTSLPRSETGLDPFLTRVEIINQIVPDAVIDGKAVRVVFTSRFISELSLAMKACGMNAQYETSVVLSQRYDTSRFTDYLSSASLNGAAGFGRQYSHGGGAQYTPYTGMGYGRQY